MFKEEPNVRSSFYFTIM